MRVDRLRECVRKIKQLDSSNRRRDLRIRTALTTLREHDRRLRRLEGAYHVVIGERVSKRNDRSQ